MGDYFLFAFSWRKKTPMKGDQIFDTTSEGWLYLVVGLDLVMGVFAFSWRKIDPKGEQILDLVMDDLLRVTLSRHENTALDDAVNRGKR